MLKFVSLVFFFSIVLNFVNSEVSKQDSYLNALQNSHQSNSERSDVSFHSSQGYEYPQVLPEYGAPPPPIYGPPKPVYGPPPPSSSIWISHPPPYYHHHREETWLDKLKHKIDLFTIGKIILKMIVLKKIIKFVALICLLLFLPKLKNLFSDDMMEEMASDESRGFLTNKGDLNERLNETTRFAETAMKSFSSKYDKSCKPEEIWCRFQRTFDVIDKKYPYEKIVELYLPKSDVTA